MPPPRHLRWLPICTLMAGLACSDGGGEVAPPLERQNAGTHANDAGDGHSHLHERPPPAQAGVEGDTDTRSDVGYRWRLPPGFPQPKVPQDNPMSESKVELGRHLFYDKRLSGNRTQSCASCHKQALAFTDGRVVGLGSTGEPHVRNSMSLANVAYASTLTWVNPVLPNLERQALLPLFGEDPVELGMVGRERELLDRLGSDPLYEKLFADAFPQVGGELSIDTVAKAIAAFQRTILSGGSDYDRYLAGEAGALNESEQRGMELFFSERMECFHCHSGFNLSDSSTHEGKAFDEVAFHNTGLYNTDGRGGFPAYDQGLFTFSGVASDIGRFKTPTLRNVGVTAPYMHDGSIETLEGVIEHYAAGGRTLDSGPHAGVGSANPNRSEFVTGFDLGDQEKADLVAFLHSLTDRTLLEDPRLSDPWPSEP